MNSQLRSTPKALRAAFAAASLLVSVLVVSALSGLADHYHAEVLLASSPAAIVASR
jgi:hypothetical protein